MTRQREIKDSALVAARCPLLAEALHHVGHVQTRNRGTLGGSLAHLDPAAELPGVLLAHDAVLEIRKGRMEPRSIADVAVDARLHDTGARTRGVAGPCPGPGRGRRGTVSVSAKSPAATATSRWRGRARWSRWTASRIGRCAIALIGVDDGPVRLGAAEALLAGQCPDTRPSRQAAAQDRTRRSRAWKTCTRAPRIGGRSPRWSPAVRSTGRWCRARGRASGS